MRKHIWAAVLAFAVTAPCVAFAAGAQQASADQLAYFQTKNIFHSGLRDTHTIALTFDDGPNANTIGVLNALKANNVKATFFIVGRMAHAHPEVLARIAAEGHLLANHSANHPMLGSRFDADPEKLLYQLRDVNDQIAQLVEKLFRVCVEPAAEHRMI